MKVVDIGEAYRRRALNRLRRRSEPVEAVFEEDLWIILRDLGLLDDLDNGRLFCPITGTILSRNTVGGLISTPDGPRPISEGALFMEPEAAREG